MCPICLDNIVNSLQPRYAIWCQIIESPRYAIWRTDKKKLAIQAKCLFYTDTKAPLDFYAIPMAVHISRRQVCQKPWQVLHDRLSRLVH